MVKNQNKISWQPLGLLSDTNVITASSRNCVYRGIKIKIGPQCVLVWDFIDKVFGRGF